jgi:hypothetical protein
MTKVVINDSYGGFTLSAIAEELYEIKSNKKFNVYDIQMKVYRVGIFY